MYTLISLMFLFSPASEPYNHTLLCQAHIRLRITSFSIFTYTKYSHQYKCINLHLIFSMCTITTSSCAAIARTVDFFQSKKIWYIDAQAVEGASGC